jgi:phosphatidylserine/phosphatidylglycerophosphate/cardiolipin synthase-like enzyme
MKWPRIRTRPAAVAALALALLSCAAREPRPATIPAVRLIETVPVETNLGAPGVASARDVWLELIRGARKSLDIEQFYVSTWPGEPLEAVLQAIGAAAARGVRVRFIVDSRMHRTYPQPIDSLGTLPGIEVRVIDIGRIAGGIQHAKYFLVDGTTTVLGSQNFDWRALEHIHELGVSIRDARVTAVFQDVFNMDWAAADTSGATSGPAPGSVRRMVPIAVAQARGDTVWVWPSYTPRSFIPDTTLWDLDALVRTIDGARSEIMMQVLKYSPESRNERLPALDDALRRAAARGVHVRMIVSDWERDGGEIRFLQDLARVPGIDVRLSTVPEWSGGYIPFARVEHCKYMVVDSDWTWVGTDNWEPGYFTSTRNLAVTMRNAGIAREARAIFEASWAAKGAAPLDPDSTYTPKVHGETPPEGATKYGG